MQPKTVWTSDEERSALWETDPERAARMAYLDVLAMWHEQVCDGEFGGVPAMHMTPTPTPTPRQSATPVESGTMRSRPSRFTRDQSASQWVVPGEIRRRWLGAA